MEDGCKFSKRKKDPKKQNIKQYFREEGIGNTLFNLMNSLIFHPFLPGFTFP